MIKTSDGGYILERTDKEKDLRTHIDQLTTAIDSVQIAMNILRANYGVEFCAVSIGCRNQHVVQLACGVDQLGEILKREVKIDTNWRAQKSFRYDWTEFLQLAEKNSMDFLPLNYRGKALYKMDGGSSDA